jgi:hypothetical protein
MEEKPNIEDVIRQMTEEHFKALVAEYGPPHGIVEAKIAPGAVTNAMIDPEAWCLIEASQRLPDGSVAVNRLADGSVTPLED